MSHQHTTKKQKVSLISVSESKLECLLAKIFHYLLMALEVNEKRNPMRVLRAITVLKYLEEGLGKEM